ncbi:hypothetical protein BEP19_13375 [Ammoniphilus oxalaticus]|uniref:Uncharacterized protein n=1 Tax=Ammoniphilus oxalaticus TaxID=66863 RepID=A0A419SF45_9BACL|nr:polysaccharide biosynthesis protein [Ammoniphilus oxalaticus]RKD22060.1 hypothetical protein BEP19_13375 [Ammoniphilus oxalaticus]
MSRNALIQGAIILTMASLVTRVLGIAQRIPLQRILGDSGMATYGIAYNIYGILLIIATVGIPTALSRQIAEYHALGQYSEAQQTFRAAQWFALVTGLVAAIFLYGLAPYYAIYVSNDPHAVLSIRAIAPALLLFPLISMMRGYFQGMQMMSPTGLSQISEQILRVGTAVAFPLLLLYAGYSHEVAIAGASFGAVAGSVGAIAIMLFYVRRTKADRLEQMKVQGGEAQTLKKSFIYKQLLKTSIPISFASTAIPVLYFIDSSTVIALLQTNVGYDHAKELLGILTGRAQSFASIPPILAIAMGSAILPVVSAAYSRKDIGEVQRMSSLALRLALITGAPIALYLTAAAFAVNGFLFKNTAGSWIIAMLCFGSIFQIVMTISTSILQGMGRTTSPMWHVFAGIVVKAMANFALTPSFGIYGVVAATSLGFIIILALNLRSIKEIAPLEILSKRWTGFLLASLAMLIVTGGCYFGVEPQLPVTWPSLLRYGLLCLITAIPGFLVYGWLMLRLGGVTEEDLSHLPARVRKVAQRM